MAATIQSIAREAGVSIATVSRVINGSANVAEPTARRIRAAARVVGASLRPRPPAKRCFRTRNIAVVYGDANQLSLNEWGFLDGFEEVFDANDLRLVVVRLVDGDSVPRLLDRRECDGIVVLPDLRDVTHEVADALASFPCIQMVRRGVPKDIGDEFFCDNRLVVELAVDHLLGHGAQRPAFFNLDRNHPACRERGELFRAELVRRGMPAPQDIRTRAAASRLFALPASRRPDALFVPMDAQLPALYDLLRSAGVEPMADIDIVSCDNSPRFRDGLSPRPAAIDLQWRELAVHAARHLLWRIEHPDAPRIRFSVHPLLVP